MRGFITIMDSLSPKLSANTQEPGNEVISPLAHFLQGWPASFIYEYKVYVLNVKLWFQFRRLQYMVVIPDHQVLPTREVELAWKKWERTYNLWECCSFHCVHQSTIVQTFHYIRLGSHTAGYVCTMHVHRPYKIKSVLQSFKQYGNTIEKAIE